MRSTDHDTDNGVQSAGPGAGEEHAKADTVLKIGHVAKQYRVSLRTLRFYEDSGLLQPERNGVTRLYRVKDCRRLEAILRGRQLGFSLAEISSLITNSADIRGSVEIEETLSPEQIRHKIDYLERQQVELIQAISALRDAYSKMTKAKLQEKCA